MDTHSWVLWIGIVAIGLHVMEEYAEGWLVWANEQVGPRFGITFTQADFFFTAFLLIFYALAGAAIGWWAPAVSLAIPALFIVNAVFLHMLPSLRSDRLTPGTLTAVFIYLPVAAWMFWAAAEDGVLNLGTVVLAFILGTALMYYPLAVAILAKRTGWQESQTSSGEANPAAAAPLKTPAVEKPEIEIEGEPVEPPTEILDPTDDQN
ncbi:MAG: HXXEE domain-containing protein [Solirubrobacterales bacterium]